MELSKAIPILIVAAMLEASGDAMMNAGLHAKAHLKLMWFLAATAVLFLYGYCVNSPPWDFGKLMGLYVVFFFIVAQTIAGITSGKWPSGPILLGGAFIVVGGLIIARSAISH